MKNSITKNTEFPFLRGANFGYLSKANFYDSDEALAEIDRMAEAGVEWVSVLVMLMQETFFSTRVFRDFTYTPTDHGLERVVERIHERGMHVLLKPIIDCRDSTWRGRITFPDGDQQIQGVLTDYWTPWFTSMTEAMVYYARFSKKFGVEAFTVAQELNGTEHMTAHWQKTVQAVREVYDGWLTVNATQQNLWRSAFQNWAKELDALGVSFYQNVKKESTTMEQMAQDFAEKIEPYRELSAKLDMPIYWAECGCRSESGARLAPHAYGSEGPPDGQEQANYLEALLKTFWDQPWWAGYQYWKWDEHQIRPHYQQPGGDTGFTIAGKPAEKVVLKWSKMPRNRSFPE